MANAGRFFADAIPAPGGAPITTGGAPDPGMETAGDFDPRIVIGTGDARGANVDLSEHRGFVGGRFEQHGWDAVAFYAPYHRHGPAMWGIYFIGDALLGMIDIVGAELRARNQRRSQAWIGAALVAAVHSHELFHFRVEWAATHAEVLTGTPSLYHRYLDCGRANKKLEEPALTEEAMATADEVRRARRIDAELGNVVGDLSLGLEGYGDFPRRLSTGGEIEGRRFLVEAIAGSASTGEILHRSGARGYERSVPTRWLSAQISVPGIDRLLLRMLALHRRDVLRDAHTRPGASVDTPRGKHPIKIRTHGKRPVPMSSSWEIVPPRVVKQLADLFDLPPAEYAQQVVSHRRDRPRAA